MYLVGQICGALGSVITILQPQFKKKVQILLCGILTNTLNAMNFLLIGQSGSAVYLCLLAVVQSLLSIRHERRTKETKKGELILFFALYIGVGIFGVITKNGFVPEVSAENIIEMLPIIGAVLFMLSVFAKGEQKTRLYLLLNATAWAIYTAFTGATAFFGCLAAMLSSAVALWKYHRKV